MSLRPLGVVKEIVESAGMEISYAYEDLVFLTQNGFLLQFTGNDRELLIHSNCEADSRVVDDGIEKLMQSAPRFGLKLHKGIGYIISENDDETIRLEFVDQKPH